MTSIRDAIRESSRLARMRAGQDAPELVEIPSRPGVRVAMVPLLEGETQRGVIEAAGLDVIDNQAGIQARNRVAIMYDVWHSLRDPDDLSRKVFSSPEDMVGEDGLESSDVDFLADNLTALMSYASPSLDGIDDAMLADLKKAFGETDWSALTGRQWAALKLAISHLFPELLQAKLLGDGSTESLTSKNENDVST